MDLPTAIAAVLGLAGAVLGGLAWRKASEARTLAAACDRIARESRQAAQDAARVAGEAAAAAAQRLPASSPDLHEAEVPVPDAAGLARTAKLVVRSGGAEGHELPTNQGHGSGLIGVFLVNEGPAVAHDLRLSAVFPNGATRSSETHHSLSARKELTLFAQVVPQDFGPATTMDVLYRVTYRDGNGDHALEQKVRVDGGWKGPWKTYIDAEHAAHVG